MDCSRTPLACADGKKIVLISHDLGQTGSPLLLAETAVRLREAGAQVRIVTLAGDADVHDLPARNGIPVLPTADSFAEAASADLVIANTTEASAWVDGYLQEHPAGGRTLVWWIHELDAQRYAPRMRSLGCAALAMFDSRASLDAWSRVGIALPPVTSVVHLGVDDAFLERVARWRSAYPARNLWERLSIRDRARAGIREELGIERHDFVVGLIGTYEARKGQDLLMSTVGRMVERDSGLPLKVILVGFLNEAERLAFLEGLAGPARKALADRRAVCLVQDPIPYYAASDALVMNTQGVGENFGRVTIEAMALGLPILGTDAGGTREIVEEGVTGLLHPVGEAGQDRLAENLLTLVLDRRRAKAMGMAGAQRVRERFAGVRFQAELGALLESVLGASLAHRESPT